MDYSERMTFDAFMKQRIRTLERAERFSTSRNYQRTWSSFSGFLGGRTLYINEMTGELVAQYNRFLSEKGLLRNTVSFYNRVLRAVFNEAVKEGLTPPGDPFRDVYTGVDVTRKRALPAEILQRIAALPCADPKMALSRDLFLFSFQTRGMSFVDMAFLTRRNLQGGFIRYVRRKTGQSISIRIEPWMQEILNRYARQSTEPYLFPILHTSEPKAAYGQYALALGRYDRLLQRVGKEAGLDLPLSSYFARHSWASIARDAQIPLSVISSGMGHTSERTTRIYLASLDNSQIDRASREVWERVFPKKL